MLLCQTCAGMLSIRSEILFWRLGNLASCCECLSCDGLSQACSPCLACSVVTAHVAGPASPLRDWQPGQGAVLPEMHVVGCHYYCPVPGLHYNAAPTFWVHQDGQDHKIGNCLRGPQNLPSRTACSKSTPLNSEALIGDSFLPSLDQLNF